MVLDKDLLSIQDVREAVKRAKEAQKIFEQLSQEEVDKAVAHLANRLYDRAEELAKMAVEETGFGNVPDKIIKNQFATKRLLETMQGMKTRGIVREDSVNKIMEIATSLGVVAGLVPSTNPTSTTIYKSLISLKSGNAIVLSPHPSALKCISKTVEYLNAACREIGLPEGLINHLQYPTIEATSALMSHNDVSMILATGGSAMVKAAYRSGTPALGVGPGNVPAFIERSADITKAVRRIIDSKTFDNGVICASEQEVVTETIISKEVIQEFIRQGGYFVTSEEKLALEKIIAKPTGGLNPKIVGKTAIEIARMAGVEVPANTKVILAFETKVGKGYPFSMEKLSPLLGFYIEDNWHAACERCMELLHYDGIGHSLSIHSEDDAIIREFALKKPASRILVNTSSSQGGVGATTNLAPAFTLGCGAVGGSATSDNVTPLHLLNIRRVAYGVREAAELKAQPNNTCNNQEDYTDLIVKKVLEQIKNFK